MNEFFIDHSDIEGYGCFTRRAISEGERFTFTVLPVNKPHNLTKHCFPLNREQSCIVLSEFSYCNSSKSPNFIVTLVDKVNRTFTFEALRDILPYEEITIDYGYQDETGSR